jgi:hypothetical protein
MESCLAEVSDWMLSNKLKMNNQKTECIIFATKHNWDIFKDITIGVRNSMIKPAGCAKSWCIPGL